MEKQPTANKYHQYRSLVGNLTWDRLIEHLYVKETKDTPDGQAKTEVKVLGIPYETREETIDKIKHKHFFGLFKTIKANNKKRYYAFGIPFYIFVRKPDLIDFRFIGISLYKLKRSDDNYKVHILGCRIRISDNRPPCSFLLKPSLNDVTSLHQETFSPYKNKHVGAEMVLLASGPSIALYNPFPHAIHVGVNRSFLKENIALDYLFIQDKSAFGEGLKKKIINYKGNNVTKFFGILSGNSSKWNIPESWSLQAGARRYYTSAGIMEDRFSLDLSNQCIGDFSSVVFAAVQFMLWCNPRKIYLVGCDCTNAPYAFDKSKVTTIRPSQIIKNWKEFKYFAGTYYPDTEIISVNPIGLKGLFKELITG